MVHSIVLPFPMYSKGRGEKKKYNLFSMNVYRNMHYMSLNKTKQDYQKLVKDWIITLPKFKTLRPEYKLYFKGKRLKDIDNFAFPIHKFLMDAFVSGGVIEDDNYNFVKGYTHDYGGSSEENYVVVKLVGETL